MTPAEQLDLPPYAHIPGQNARPDTTGLAQISAGALSLTSSASAHENLAWQYGIRLISSGFYWEAHEVLESVWLKAAPNSREWHLLKGVIHVTNSALKVRMGRAKAAQRLSNMAKDSITRSFSQESDSLMGLLESDLLLAATLAADTSPDKRNISLPLLFNAC
ncbi:MAG: DUF309 domain-containing protein [Granulosicoccus sp.]